MSENSEQSVILEYWWLVSYKNLLDLMKHSESGPLKSLWIYEFAAELSQSHCEII